MSALDQLHFKRLVLKRAPRLVGKRESTENSFWKRFQFPIVAKENAAVTSVHFCPTPPFDFAVTAGSKVQVYSSVTNEVKKTISRFEEAAYSGCIRGDGQLLAAGGERGVVKIFDLNSRAVLRECKGHAKAVKTVNFCLDGLKILSGSEDTSIRHWDLATGSCITTLRGHKDYVRRVLCTPTSSELVLSGSYDHTLRLWDLRTGTAVLECNHGAPIETLLMFPSGGAGVSAGGNVVRVWDLLRSARRPLTSFSSHQKTVTALALDGSSHRLLSGGLDKQLKVYSVEDYSVIHSMAYPAPILSLAMAPSDTHLVVGMSSRLLSIKHCPRKQSSTSSRQTTRLKVGTYRYFVRGKNYHPQRDEYLVSVPKKMRFSKFDNFLRRFQYREALNSALAMKWKGVQSHIQLIYSLLQELVRRDALSTALAGRREDELYPLLVYLRFQVLNPLYASFMLDILDMVIDMYGAVLLQSNRCSKLIKLTKMRLGREIEFQKISFQLLGTIDALLTAATATQMHTNLHEETGEGEESIEGGRGGGGGDGGEGGGGRGRGRGTVA